MGKADRGLFVKLRYVHTYRDRHGKVRHYFYLRRPGWRKIPLPGEPESDEFMTAYMAARAAMQMDRPSRPELHGSGSVSNTIAAYYTDNSFLSFSLGTQKTRRAILERFRRNCGDLKFAAMQRKDVAALLGRMKPFAARNWLKTLRGLFAFAVGIGLRADDPSEGIKPAKAKAGSIHTWTEDEIAIFERYYPVGTRARLAMALMLYTAARRGDIIHFGPQHISADRLRYTQKKTGRPLVIPVQPELAAIIAATPCGHLSFLTTERGHPFTSNGFGNWFRKICRAAGLPHCSAHGLRKAQARRLAESGRSTHEIASVTGHKTLSQVQHYTEAAAQERLAARALRRPK